MFRSKMPQLVGNVEITQEPPMDQEAAQMVAISDQCITILADRVLKNNYDELFSLYKSGHEGWKTLCKEYESELRMFVGIGMSEVLKAAEARGKEG